MLLAALAVVLWRRRLAFFWLMLALLTYGVVSNIPFPIGTIFGERLLYLPSVGSGRPVDGPERLPPLSAPFWSSDGGYARVYATRCGTTT